MYLSCCLGVVLDAGGSVWGAKYYQAGLLGPTLCPNAATLMLMRTTHSRAATACVTSNRVGSCRRSAAGPSCCCQEG